MMPLFLFWSYACHATAEESIFALTLLSTPIISTIILLKQSLPPAFQVSLNRKIPC